MTSHIHENQPLLQIGTELEEADAVVILLHGRGATAESMAGLANVLETEGVTFLIPQAAQNRWYPNTAFGPLESNEPDLSSALAMLSRLSLDLEIRGIPKEKLILGGFSQGACLASEFTARNPAHYGGLFVLSGALIGPPGTKRNYPGSLGGTPVFIGSSDIDPWVAHELVSETAEVLEGMGAEVDFRTYPGMGHIVIDDEVQAIQEMLAGISTLVS